MQLTTSQWNTLKEKILSSITCPWKQRGNSYIREVPGLGVVAVSHHYDYSLRIDGVEIESAEMHFVPFGNELREVLLAVIEGDRYAAQKHQAEQERKSQKRARKIEATEKKILDQLGD